MSDRSLPRPPRGDRGEPGCANVVAAVSQLRPGLSPSGVSDLKLVPTLPEDGGVDSAEPEEKRRRVEPEAAAEAALEGEAEEPAEARRVVPTAEEEEAMGQDIETYLRERQVLGTPAERLIRLEYVEWAKRLVDEGEEERAEGRRAAAKKEPYRPTLQEWREHRLTHLPYRDWCPDCVAGKCADDPHRRRDEPTESASPEFHFDYAFFRNQTAGVQAVVVVGKERKTKFFVAHVVPSKGSRAEWVPRQLAKDLKKMGCHGRVLIRTDGENAIKDLAAEVARARGDLPTVLESPPPTDSKANGFAERAVRSLEEQTRVFKTAFQSSTKKVLEVDVPGMAWLVEHSADTLNKALVGTDGRTAYERVRGRPYRGQLYEFGQVIWSKLSGKPIGGAVSPRWIKGIWLGKLWNTDEHIVSEPGGGVIRARTVKAHPEIWNRELFDQITSWPSDAAGRRPVGGDLGARVDSEVPVVPSSRPEPQSDQRRQGE